MAEPIHIVISKAADVPENLRMTQAQLDALPDEVKAKIATLPPEQQPIPRKPVEAKPK
jgi:hypothetical protein